MVEASGGGTTLGFVNIVIHDFISMIAFVLSE